MHTLGCNKFLFRAVASFKVFPDIPIFLWTKPVDVEIQWHDVWFIWNLISRKSELADLRPFSLKTEKFKFRENFIFTFLIVKNSDFSGIQSEINHFRTPNFCVGGNRAYKLNHMTLKWYQSSEIFTFLEHKLWKLPFKKKSNRTWHDLGKRSWKIQNHCNWYFCICCWNVYDCIGINAGIIW